MQILKEEHNIAVVKSEKLVITDTQSALDLMATIRYEFETDKIIIDKSAIAEDFFVLSTGLAGDILQKFSNYRVMLAIVGDFSHYTSKPHTSKPLKDFIYESNKGKSIYFAATVDKAVEWLARL